MSEMYMDRLGRVNEIKNMIVSAHLDTVFPPETDLEVKREGGTILGRGLVIIHGRGALFVMWMLPTNINFWRYMVCRKPFCEEDWVTCAGHEGRC